MEDFKIISQIIDELLEEGYTFNDIREMLKECRTVEETS